MNKFNLNVRTDLALETKESLDEDGKLRGVIFDEKKDEKTGITISRLEILNALGEKNMKRAKGVYYTFETVSLSENDGGYHRGVSEFLAGYIKKTLIKNMKKEPPYHILVAGLGNREATPDALGPYVVNNLDITDSVGVAGENGVPDADARFAYVSAIAPGVMAQTGMETADILKGIVRTAKPDCIIAIDALAARSTARLACTIQLTDTGIMPGSGVGNHRNAIDNNNMGVPVIAIGVPTVVDAATIVGDALEGLLDSMDYSERKQVVRDFIPQNMYQMYVTPKDVDEMVKRISYTISEAINISMSS